MRRRHSMMTAKRLYEIVGALFGLFALGLQFHLLFVAATALGRTPGGILVQFASFFTILSNTLVVLCYCGGWRAQTGRGGVFARPGVQTAVALYIAIVGAVYVAVLQQLWNPAGWALVADSALHHAAPVLYLVYWLIFVDTRRLRFADIPAWLVFPVVYCAYALIRGALSGLYPYPFLDAPALGYGRVALNIAILVVAFAVTGAVLVAVAKARRRALPADSGAL